MLPYSEPAVVLGYPACTPHPPPKFIRLPSPVAVVFVGARLPPETAATAAAAAALLPGPEAGGGQDEGAFGEVELEAAGAGGF